MSHGQNNGLKLQASGTETSSVSGWTSRFGDEETELTADLLKSLAGKNTVVVIDHDMEFIRDETDVTVLNQGTVLCEGKMEKIQNDPKVIEVYLGKQEENK